MLSTTILNIFVLLLFGFGILSLLVLIQGWFGLTTCSGNEDKAEAAKRQLLSGAICLAVVLTLFTVGHHFIKKIDVANAEGGENFDKIFTTAVE